MSKKEIKTRTVNLKDNNGTKRKVRAITIGDYNLEKSRESKQLYDDPFDSSYDKLKLKTPPFNLAQFSSMSANSSELGQCIEAMEINIDGFGGRYIPRLAEKDRVKFKDELEDEIDKIDEVLKHLNPDYNLTKLRRNTRKDLEQTGNGYWEIVRDKNDQIHSIYQLESYTIRISKVESKAINMQMPLLKRDYTIKQKTFKKRFRRFCQIRGMKKVWFKEYGDPRVIDWRTGEVAKLSLDRKYWATEVIHFKIFTANSVYGIPRYIGNLFSILGSRASDEINFLTFQNNNIPSMVILVSNARLTDGSISRINEFVEAHIKRSKNRSGFLLLEAESFEEEAVGGSHAKIETQDLTKSQNNDQLFQEYDKNNAKKIRRSFRLSDEFLGEKGESTSTDSESAKKLAEEQVFAPERDQTDYIINMLLLDLGIRYWFFKSNSANVTSDKDLVEVLNKSEKSGAMTPNLGRQLLSDILNREIEPYAKTDDFDPDVPFSLTMADAVKNMNGQAPNQGQIPKPKNLSVEKIYKMLEAPHNYVDELLDISKQVEEYLNKNIDYEPIKY